MFESSGDRVLPFGLFAWRMAYSLGLAMAIVSVALGIGIVGYHFFAGLDWIDAILDASMILTGMGPVSPMTTTAAKLFASAYAMFSGVVFLTSMSIVLAPVFHRVLHKFHLSEEDEEQDEPGKPGNGK
jgi:hypothetical protein